ncbi:monofunctional biosynthetic peptidoglycan transglycosylase [Bordetella bronchiseptica]|uniref:monofunctional biosynthetic peptidoglycan transglycosylase n=1 Tax=Bordetella bronchiseptica TaxID=518 RepID=UPI00028B773F|nr:monofunctional biosynthetic peptidoglycan transglycosylase [Bordetella bronchiseptica]KCV33553.1 monofunctional biosynthetic peptidoglycan transglycosylase [Bordetella bronchiseptica 00-P-2730]AUL17244.1 monofunctional biosynthetic peptidoglycan transglycosylase [Bordetella bronchiseptica]AWP60477.1 monofunctional biosynthetic peptidoglycan transglycosylase [Bordetella bronchiseptica]AWQ07329.1 monofunctional biosynthetic peptidoglycan transglycosylase [Bordetella bronchiseptica]AZW32756.1 
MPKSTARRLNWFRVITAVIMAVLCIAILYQLWMFSLVVWYAYRDPGSSAIMRQELARLRERDPAAELKYQWVPYDRISNTLKQAVVASEDANFTEHDGVEWDAIRKAWEYNQRQAERGRTKMRGGSTITQQLAKNLFLSGSRSYLRKGQELVLAYMIEHVMPKERILELYLNVAEWGVGVFGAEAAARHYYNTSAARLGAGQAARMAAMLPNPRYYDRHRNTGYLNSRTATLTRRMRMVEIP